MLVSVFRWLGRPTPRASGIRCGPHRALGCQRATWRLWVGRL